MAQAPRTFTFPDLKRRITAKDFAPVYLLHGEEGYYIDALVEMFERSVPEADRDFNLYTFYAPETEMDRVVDTCRRYPMMADRQMVILKEAQGVTANELSKLAPYASNANPTTVLVVCCRGVKNKSKDFEKAVAASGGVVFEAQKLRKPDVAIQEFITERGLRVEPKGLSMLAEYVGSDLSRLYNEIDKLTVALPKGAMVTPEVIESHIGMSKDYNNFELLNALSTRNVQMAARIVAYFRSNPKNNPVPVTMAMIWGYFSNLLLLLYCRDKSEAALCAQIGRKGNYLTSDYKSGMRQYDAWQLIDIIHQIRLADGASKGIGSRRDAYDVLSDLVFRILTTTGR